MAATRPKALREPGRPRLAKRWTRHGGPRRPPGRGTCRLPNSPQSNGPVNDLNHRTPQSALHLMPSSCNNVMNTNNGNMDAASMNGTGGQHSRDQVLRIRKIDYVMRPSRDAYDDAQLTMPSHAVGLPPGVRRIRSSPFERSIPFTAFVKPAISPSLISVFDDFPFNQPGQWFMAGLGHAREASHWLFASVAMGHGGRHKALHTGTHGITSTGDLTRVEAIALRNMPRKKPMRDRREDPEVLRVPLRMPASRTPPTPAQTRRRNRPEGDGGP